MGLSGGGGGLRMNSKLEKTDYDHFPKKILFSAVWLYTANPKLNVSHKWSFPSLFVFKPFPINPNKLESSENVKIIASQVISPLGWE